MVSNNPFSMDGNWYKGNLHTHTTQSDGDRSPAEMAGHYHAAGYDFLCLTDHNKVTDVTGLSSGDFLVIPGAELDATGDEAGLGYHLAAIGIRETDGLSHTMDAQDAIDAVVGKGGAVVAAHPYWSALTTGDLLRLSGHMGLEIYNTSCQYSIGKGCSLAYWDALLARGRAVWGVAADDAHWHFNDHRPVDACGGWVMVKAPALTEPDILNALRRGHFYASNGPSIDDVRVGDASVTVEAPGSKSIHFIANRHLGESFTDPAGAPVSAAEYKPTGAETYLRVECIQPDGRAAWSNPLWVGEQGTPRS